MYKKILIYSVLLLVFTNVKAQELDCVVSVNSSQIQVSNNRIFKTLENSLTELMNQTKWTNLELKDHEKIKCALTILLTEQTEMNSFKGSIQIQVSRPVFNTTYYSPVFNHKDDSFTFSYTEFQPLNFNLNVYKSNLISVMSYYAYVMLGVYQDTFNIKGGEDALKKALTIANQAQQSGSIGWENSRNETTRFTLIDQWLSGGNESVRELYYRYHYECLDSFESNPRFISQKIISSLKVLEDLYNLNPNNILIRVIMNTKADELVNMFRKDRQVDTAVLLKMLKKIAPNQSKKWKQIYSN